MKKKHDKIFDILFKLATAVEPVAKQRLAACLMYKNEIISFGINKKKSHPLQKKFGKNSSAIFCHAEMSSIINALRDYDVDFLKKCSLYVMRVKYHEEDHSKLITGLAKPCVGCMSAIENFELKECYYSIDDYNGFIGLCNESCN